MTIRIEKRHHVAVVTPDRPEKKHAITTEMRVQLYEAFENPGEDNGVRAVILTGTGDDFCSGMDVGEFGESTMADHFVRTIRLQRVGRAIYRLNKPTIAAVRAICMGAGWSLPP
jgi:2-(1,2-epoxy-1,2-dihydrophenyl)acetyl-CoA isomerase